MNEVREYPKSKKPRKSGAFYIDTHKQTELLLHKTFYRNMTLIIRYS